MRPTRAEIDLTAIAHNFREVRRVTGPPVKVMGVVKANAYGHGMVEVARTLVAEGADWLGVAILEEAVILREAGFQLPILVFGYVPPHQAEVVVQHQIRQSVYSLEQAQNLAAAAQRLHATALVHVKIDTGMGRLGFLPTADARQAVLAMARLPRLEVEGVFTHFAVADEMDKSFTILQWERFQDFTAGLQAAGLTVPIRHAANSAAVIDLPETHGDLVRPGIMIYGLYPSGEVNRERVRLRPAMTVKSRVALVKEVPAGATISYGRTFRAAKPTVVVTIPMGYADGYSRLLSNRGTVLINGIPAPVIGRVCMDQFMVDATGVGAVSMGDEVVVMGRQGDREISADAIAAQLGTINYEVVCMLSARVPRYYINGQAGTGGC